MNPQETLEDKGFFDRTFDYVFNPPGGELAASQLLQTQVSIDVDAEFWLGSWYVATSTGAFEILLTDSDGYQMEDTPINSSAMSFTGPLPQVFSPAHRFPAGGRIQIQIRNLTGAPNTVQIVFKGWKRFYRPVAQAA